MMKKASKTVKDKVSTKKQTRIFSRETSKFDEILNTPRKEFNINKKIEVEVEQTRAFLPKKKQKSKTVVSSRKKREKVENSTSTNSYLKNIVDKVKHKVSSILDDSKTEGSTDVVSHVNENEITESIDKLENVVVEQPTKDIEPGFSSEIGSPIVSSCESCINGSCQCETLDKMDMDTKKEHSESDTIELDKPIVSYIQKAEWFKDNLPIKAVLEDLTVRNSKSKRILSKLQNSDEKDDEKIEKSNILINKREAIIEILSQFKEDIEVREIFQVREVIIEGESESEQGENDNHLY